MGKNDIYRKETSESMPAIFEISSHKTSFISSECWGKTEFLFCFQSK